MMIKLGFSNSWVRKLMHCVSSVSYSYLINSEVHGFLKPSKGLRQGDPLSPYLFLLCAEGFSSLLAAAERDKAIRGITCGRGGPSISHLFFSDDSLFFLRTEVSDCIQVQSILSVYERVSGQTINREKSAVCFNDRLASHRKEVLSCLLGVHLVACYERYLGLSSFVGRSRRNLFNSIRDRVWSKLQSWKGSLFFAGGKEVLIKAVVQAIPIYSMILFRLPQSLIADLHRLMSRFWWGSSDSNQRIHWCSWSYLCLNKLNGGLSFRDLSLFNQALLAKQGWKIFSNPSALVSRVLKGLYFPSCGFLQARLIGSFSAMWRGILWGRNLLEKGLRWRVGVGSSVSMYHNKWIPMQFSFRASPS
ncbi:hypothetical protein ACOSP7_002975 [Xanthoceras sorbifolium]